ncbi:MAG: hypothetical protein GX295_11760 [Syntrophomonadaceae bacterium]|nr:hypothetical protein [Syntrophomonadaceae bacterium]
MSLWRDQSGLSTIEILVGMIVLVLLAIISFAALRGGVEGASRSLGDKTKGMVDSSSATVKTDGTPDVTLEFKVNTP